jgi:hypothetical protein
LGVIPVRALKARQTDAGGQLWQGEALRPAQQFASRRDQGIELLRRALSLWRAAFARAKTSGFGTGGIVVEADVVTPRPSGRAARPAIDTGAAHGEDETPVLRSVAFAHGLPAAFLVEHRLCASGREFADDCRLPSTPCQSALHFQTPCKVSCMTRRAQMQLSAFNDR